MSTKILDATTGSSTIFHLPQRELSFKLVIIGTASSNIKAFYEPLQLTRNILLKISGVTGSGAYVKLQSKSNNADDDFTDIGQDFNDDFTGTTQL